MQLIYNKFGQNIVNAEECVVCLGFFDGVHKGHVTLIKTAVDEAKKRGLKSCVYTFNISPKVVTKKEKSSREITPIDIKSDIIEHLGVDIMYVDSFTEEFSKLSPEEFVKQVIIERLNAKCIVAGFHYKFGCKGSGNVKLLEKLCKKYGIDIFEIAPVQTGEEIAASRVIKALIKEGKMQKVTEMLGRPYFIKAEVLYGQQLGRELSTPTINQVFPAGNIIPAIGVYLTKTTVEGKTYFSVTNVGKKPTVKDNDNINVETHIFDFTENIYGKVVLVEFLEMIRDERKFSSIEQLKEQLQKDIQKARELSGKY